MKLCTITMGQMTFIIDDNLDQRFRESLSKKFGYRKGNMQKAFEESLELFIKKNS